MPDTVRLQTPVLLLVFNRPETTRAVFESIRSARPTEYFVAADGPRPDRKGEAERCEAARKIATTVDWDCKLHTLLRQQNLGAGPAVASAVSWFFDQVEAGIILEDDCVPSQSFYKFCEELLAHYQTTESVMHIAGHNFQYGRLRGNASYYFSRWPHSGGWATWRRAWRHYDFALIPEADRHDVWDGQWLLSVEKQKGVAILPNVNLVTNIGYGPDATHTRTPVRAAFLEAHEITFPLRHPKTISIDRQADELTYYANIRNIRDLRLIPLYEAWDYVAFRVKKLFKMLLGVLLGRAGRNVQ